MSHSTHETRGWQWDPARSLLASIHAFQQHRAGRGPGAVFLRKLARLRHRFWSVLTSRRLSSATTRAGRSRPAWSSTVTP